MRGEGRWGDWEIGDEETGRQGDREMGRWAMGDGVAQGIGGAKHGITARLVAVAFHQICLAVLLKIGLASPHQRLVLTLQRCHSFVLCGSGCQQCRAVGFQAFDGGGVAAERDLVVVALFLHAACRPFNCAFLCGKPRARCRKIGQECGAKFVG